MAQRYDTRAARLLAFVVAALWNGAAAAENVPQNDSSRWDVALELPIWSSLQDLTPAAGGSYDSIGAGLGGAWHFAVRRYENSTLLLGVDGFIAATDSNIAGSYETLLARQLYIGASVKWLMGASRNWSVDGGIGYHEIDMAQVDYSLRGTYEAEHWSRSRAGVWVGLTWDAGAGRPGRRSGLSLGIRAHFADFGTVADEDPNYFALGDDAGKLTGPMIVLRIAYSGR